MAKFTMTVELQFDVEAKDFDEAWDKSYDLFYYSPFRGNCEIFISETKKEKEEVN